MLCVQVKPDRLPDNVGECTTDESEDEYFVPKVIDASNEGNEADVTNNTTMNDSTTIVTKGSSKSAVSTVSKKGSIGILKRLSDQKMRHSELHAKGQKTYMAVSKLDNHDFEDEVENEQSVDPSVLNSPLGRHTQEMKTVTIKTPHTQNETVNSDIFSHIKTNDFPSQRWNSANDIFPPSTDFNHSLHRLIPNKTVSTLTSLENKLFPIQESYSYGPDSLRVNKITGRVGRPIFQEPSKNNDSATTRMLAEFEKSDDATGVSYSDEAKKILEAYSYDDLYATHEEKEKNQELREGQNTIYTCFIN